MPTTTQAITVYLIDSGLTSWDVEKRVQGNADLPLCETGQQELVHRAERFSSTSVKFIYSAPDEASVATAERFAKVISAKVKVLEDLSEVDMGLWQGLTRQTLQKRYSKAYQLWQHDPFAVTIPESEDLSEAAERLTGTVSRLIARASGHNFGLVLRPIAAGLIRCWLNGHGLPDFKPNQPTQGVDAIELNPHEITRHSAA